jgi:hypothetical protein
MGVSDFEQLGRLRAQRLRPEVYYGLVFIHASSLYNFVSECLISATLVKPKTFVMQMTKLNSADGFSAIAAQRLTSDKLLTL